MRWACASWSRSSPAAPPGDSRARHSSGTGRRDGHSWPWVTFGVNLAGTALLAYVVTRLSHRPLRPPLIGIGLCGALTTFSTLQLEALELADNGHALLGATYALTSIAAGLLVAYALTRRPARLGPGPARAGRPVVRMGSRRRDRRSVDRRRRGQRRRGLGAIRLAHGGAAVVAELLPVRDAGRQRARFARARRPARRGRDRGRAAARGHGAARLVHDVLDLDARDRGAARERTGPASPPSTCSSASRSASPPSAWAGPPARRSSV